MADNERMLDMDEAHQPGRTTKTWSSARIELTSSCSASAVTKLVDGDLFHAFLHCLDDGFKYRRRIMRRTGGNGGQ